MEEVKLRFNLGGTEQPTGGVFDTGGQEDVNSDPFSSWTKSSNPNFVAPIPQPSEKDKAEALAKGIDPKTGMDTQPRWCSVLIKRQAPFWIVRILTLNCFCRPRYTLTRAQWIWFGNLIAAVVHWYFAIIVFSEGASKGEKLNVQIFRISPAWNNTGASGYTFTLIENGMPVRFDIITGLFFLLSALSHTFTVVVGPFDFSIWFLWRQLDLCFLYWRWVEYSFSAPLMLFCLTLLTGLREQNTLASVFVLMWVTNACGFLTEYYSRPKQNKDGSWSMELWEGDPEPVRPGVAFRDLNAEDACKRMLYNTKRRQNYIRRMWPFTVGLFPYITAWVLILSNFLKQLEDLKGTNESLYDRIPPFVPYAVFSTCAVFSLFTLPIMIHQWLPPRRYWETEIWYVALSLTSKVLLGSLLYVNVLMAGSFEEALALDQNTTATA